MVVLGQDTALVLLVLLGMLQVLLDMVLVLLDMVPVLQNMVPVVGWGRSPEGRGTPGTPPEPVAGSPRRASPGVGAQRGCCWWAKRRITANREKRMTLIDPGLRPSPSTPSFCAKGKSSSAPQHWGG